MRHFTRARRKLSDELKREESIKKPEQEQENEEISFINLRKISTLERRKFRTSCRTSGFITEQTLNGEQIINETINLVLKSIKNQYSYLNEFENTTVGQIRQHYHHKRNSI